MGGLDLMRFGVYSKDSIEVLALLSPATKREDDEAGPG